MYFFDVMLAGDETTARRETEKNNSARLALYRHSQESTGVGTVTIETPILFEVAFIEEPHFTQGASCRIAADPAVWSFPVGTAGVWKWERNVKGHYIGAYIYLDVRMNLVDALGYVESYPFVAMIHSLLFTGIAYKDLGPEVSIEAQAMIPRTVNFGGA